MFDALADRFDGIFTKLRSRGKLTDKDIDEVAPRAAARAARGRRQRRRRPQLHRAGSRSARSGAEVTKSLSPAQQVIKIVNEELVKTLGGTTGKLTMTSKPPSVVMMAGLQGSGKTTASAKLARHPEEPGPPAAARRRRPPAPGRGRAAAGARRARRRAGVLGAAPIRSRSRVARLEEAARLGRDVVIVDTAGRLQIDAELMDELREVRDVVQPERHAARRRRDDRSGGGERRRPSSTRPSASPAWCSPRSTATRAVAPRSR